MECIQHDGHLSDQALRALAENGPLTELERLELAEHLAYCDECLLRYTALLTEEQLDAPPEDCRAGVWHRIRRRTLSLLSSRYATAAAALVLAASLWAFGVFDGMVQVSRQISVPPAHPVSAARMENWPRQWSDALSERLANVFDFFDGPTSSVPTQGGNS